VIIDTILKNCSKRQNHKCDEQCENCSYGEFCPEDCEKCLEYIHYPYRAKDGAPKRKYDCPNMADFGLLSLLEWSYQPYNYIIPSAAPDNNVAND